MKKGLQFSIDKLTKSIEEVSTGKSFATAVVRTTKDEINTIHKKNGWSFNWKKEFRETGHDVYKLVLAGGTRIQGLVSIEPITEQLYIEMHLIESAPHNFGRAKRFAGVPGNLVAFCCKMSFDLQFGGYVAFSAKTELMDHYIHTLGAEMLYGNRMAIPTETSKKLVNLYYKNRFNE